MTRNDDQDDCKGNPRRITVNAARRMLGMVGRNYSDADIQKLLDHLYSIAGSAFENYLDTAEPTDIFWPFGDPEISE